MRTHYRNGEEIGLKHTGCDGCTPLMINGVLCHETGCPYAWKDDPASIEAWEEAMEEQVRMEQAVEEEAEMRWHFPGDYRR